MPGWNGFAALADEARAAHAESKGSIGAVLDGVAEALALVLGGAAAAHEGTTGGGWNCGLTEAVKGVEPTAETVAAG